MNSLENDNNLIESLSNYKYFKEVFNYIKTCHTNKSSEFIRNLILSEKKTFDILLFNSIQAHLLPFIKPIELLENQINRFQFSCDNDLPIQEISLFINQVFHFDCFTYQSPLYWKKDINSTYTCIVSNTFELIDLLGENSSFSGLDGYKEELVNSISNSALIMTLASDSSREIKQSGIDNNWKYLSDYVDHQLKINPLFDKFIFYDQLHINGHHIHPSFKLRLGLSCEEVIKYSYELKNQLPIRFIGLHRSVGRFSLIDKNLDPSDYFLSLFTSMKQPIENYCNDIGVDIKEYLICPMYPFQVTNTFPNQFQEELSNKKLILFPDSIQVPSFPSLSLRNLIPIIEENRFAPHIKFSVPIRVTSWVRFMPNYFMRVGPSISKLLTKISQLEESTFKNKVIFLNELGGIYHSNTELRYQNFAIIWKENINLFLQSKDDQPISSCSLFNPSPISPLNVSILGELIHQYLEYHCTPNGMTQKDGIRKWFQLYSKLLLHPNLVLVSKYGVGLESHLQNTVCIYNKGEPKQIAQKDWSGIRVNRQRLNNLVNVIPTTLVNEIPTELFYEHLEFLRIFTHCAIFNHLAQFIVQICKDFKDTITDTILWEDVYDVFKFTFNEIKKENNPIINDQIDQDERVLFEKTFRFKSIVKTRLLKDNDDYIPLDINNILNSFIKK